MTLNSSQDSSNSHTFESLSAILNSLDALVYVSTLDTHELLFMNKHGIDAWGQFQGKKCHDLLQNKSEPCEFCTNSRLVDADGQPSGIYVWEFQNLVTKRWYQCRDEAIPWIDGSLVRIEIAFDITERKQNELALIDANESLKKLAGTDSLTGIMNRRAFIEIAEKQVLLSASNGGYFSMVLMDIDYFKKFNDNYGHAVGDEVLIKVAEVVRNIIRKPDVFARFGGEEFILLLPETDEQQVINLLNRIQLNLHELYLDSIGEHVAITFSFGVAFFEPKKQLDHLIHDADTALYQAKNKGRNRIEMYKKPESLSDDDNLSGL